MICYCPQCQAENSCTNDDRSLVCAGCGQSFAVAVPMLAPQESATLQRASGGWLRSLVVLAGILLAVWIASLLLVPHWDRSGPRSRSEDESRTAVENYLLATLDHPEFNVLSWHVGETDSWGFRSLEPTGSILNNPCAQIRTGDPFVVVRLSFQARSKERSSYQNQAMTFFVNNHTNKVFAAGEQPPAELFDELLKNDSTVDGAAKTPGGH